MGSNQLGRIERRADGWWIVGMLCQDMGPYRTQQEASEDRQGVQRFYRETTKEKQRSLFSGLKCEPGQRDLFDDIDQLEESTPRRLPIPRKQLEDAVLNRSTLYDTSTLRTMSDARLLEVWEMLKR
jgi:hypothetical protein